MYVYIDTMRVYTQLQLYYRPKVPLVLVGPGPGARMPPKLDSITSLEGIDSDPTTPSPGGLQRSLSSRARDSLRQQEEQLNIEEAELSHAGVHSPTRSTSIQDRRAKVRSEKRRLGRDISERAVTVRWLTQWCDKYDLWKVPTWQVVDDVIKVLTAQRRCRFVDLEEEVHDDEMGTVDVFISHCWANEFGDLVAAAQHNSRPDRKVWRII